MLAHQGDYGIVMQLSRDAHVSRPTLYAWRQQAQAALVQAFTPLPPPPEASHMQARQILTAWMLHASTRGVQLAMRELAGQGLSLATITAVLAEAEHRALTWMQTHTPASVRALAIDEIYTNDRRGAYLNVVDVHSAAVWASEGPLPVDAESWTLVLWSLQDRGLRWDRVVGDDGVALKAACQIVRPDLAFQSDQWHLLHSCGQVQARLDRRVRDLEAQTVVVARQAARLATGQRPQGRHPKTDVPAHAAEVARARQVALDVRFLTGEVQRLVQVVVLDQRGIVTPPQRQADLDALLELLTAVAVAAPAPQQDEVQRLVVRLRNAVPQLLTFVPQVGQVQHDLASVLVPAQQALLGWAWLRRHTLGWSSREIGAAIPAAWQAAARVLLAAWDDAVRVSSAVERWHSIMRPHLAVHRTMATGRLALLAVWHNHRVFRRGVHKGKSPLHLSGMIDAPTDWLVALGYPAEDACAAGAAAAVALAA
jgi:hypothetical protein